MGERKAAHLESKWAAQMVLQSVDQRDISRADCSAVPWVGQKAAKWVFHSAVYSVALKAELKACQ